MNVNYELLGKRIKEARLKKKLTQSRLAEMTDLSDTYISHVEKGLSKPSLETLVKISNTLETSIDFFLSNSVYVSKELLSDEFADLIKDCSNKDLKLIYDMTKLLLEHKYKD
ncbi:helix-turn-helix transcriptional regulator [Clostridium sp. C8-1-8]|uniref:helix-turn-helix domain-containing protein n=1 Tax=Clostridium sp. C8-1-8 TaxID=2698831 RepID=UPI00136FD005|nr:helix-turn-helix transcriptional regulator [Clostridium sp. C8-1-8]